VSEELGVRCPKERHTRIFQVADIEDALEHVIPLALAAKIQPRDERLAQAAISGSLPGSLEIAGVGGEDIVLGGGERIVDGLEGSVARLGGEGGKGEGGQLGRGGGGFGGLGGQRHDDILETKRSVLLGKKMEIERYD
jgi:hypothetical protein